MDPKIIGILVSFIILIAVILFVYIRKKKTEEYVDSESKLFLSNLTSAIIDTIDDYLTLENFNKILEDHYSDDFTDSENYIMNTVVNSLYDNLYDFILSELEKESDKDKLSKAMYKLIKKNKDNPDTTAYNFIYHILDSEDIKSAIEDLSIEYWKNYGKELDELESKHEFDKYSEYVEDLENESEFVPEKEDEDEIDESTINPPSDEEIPFDSSIDEVIEEGEEEVTYFFDSRGRKRDKKTGRYTK